MCFIAYVFIACVSLHVFLLYMFLLHVFSLHLFSLHVILLHVFSLAASVFIICLFITDIDYCNPNPCGAGVVCTEGAVNPSVVVCEGKEIILVHSENEKGIPAGLD